MKSLTLKDAEFIITHWPLTAHHRLAAETMLANFKGLQKEAQQLADENERLQPPVDSTHIIPVMDHVRAIEQRDKIIDELREEIRVMKEFARIESERREQQSREHKPSTKPSAKGGNSR